MVKHGSIALALVSLMVLSSSVIAQSATLFRDVTVSDYFYEATERFARTGLLKGYPNGRFGPHDYVTRGQVAVILDRYDTTVIQPLRSHIELIRRELGMGYCGDSTVQTAEQCDDGNQIDGDGCTKECIAEIHCSGGYKVGETFPATDGCNTCTCTESGVACTTMACSATKCFNSTECAQGQVCTTEQGDCRYPCPAGAECVQACAGVCIAAPSLPSSSSSAQVQRTCQQQEEAIDALFEQEFSCTEDADCALLTRGCSPYLTCGKPVAKHQLQTISDTINSYATSCGGNEPQVCAGCVELSVRCDRGVCALNEE